MATKTEAASQVRTVLQAVKDRLAQPGGAKLNEATRTDRAIITA